MEAVPARVSGEPETPTIAEDPALGLSRRTKFEILGAVLLGVGPQAARMAEARAGTRHGGAQTRPASAEGHRPEHTPAVD